MKKPDPMSDDEVRALCRALIDAEPRLVVQMLYEAWVTSPPGSYLDRLMREAALAKEHN